MQTAHLDQELVDVVIIGGGAAGLSAALTLGRARRSVIVVDDGEPRNAPAPHMHGYLTRDGISPSDFLTLARDEVRAYGVSIIDGRVLDATRLDDGTFVVELDGRAPLNARRLLFATGLVDELPAVDGLSERWGRDVVPCPYCHGWEIQDRTLVVISTGPMGVHQAGLFRQWSADVTLLVHTGPAPTDIERHQLESRNVRIVEGAVTEVIVDNDKITGVRLVDATVVAADVVVVGPRLIARAAPLESLGLVAVEHPMGVGTVIEADEFGATSVPGVWVAGNLADLRWQVLPAAANGTMVAAAINADLIADDTAIAVDATKQGTHTRLPVMDRAFWEERYRSAPTLWSGNPNPHLVSDTIALTRGSALDVGAGEGADAIWLAEQGWTVTAVDISQVALDRGRQQAALRGGAIADRITWLQADVLDWSPPAASFDLVSLQFMHFAVEARRRLFERCRDAVAPGGTLLIVGHHPLDLQTTAHRPPIAELFYTADDVAEMLDERWEIVAADARPRPAVDLHGTMITIHDTVLNVRRVDPVPTAKA